jgi:hypothetical protein
MATSKRKLIRAYPNVVLSNLKNSRSTEDNFFSGSIKGSALQDHAKWYGQYRRLYQTEDVLIAVSDISLVSPEGYNYYPHFEPSTFDVPSSRNMGAMAATASRGKDLERLDKLADVYLSQVKSGLLTRIYWSLITMTHGVQLLVPYTVSEIDAHLTKNSSLFDYSDPVYSNPWSPSYRRL